MSQALKPVKIQTCRGKNLISTLEVKITLIFSQAFSEGNTNSSAIILLRDPANSGKHRPALLLQTLIVIFTVMHLGGKS